MNDINAGIVTDIERSSPHDGPGLRTVVFLKGCPLKCRWCHNPECIKPMPEFLFYPDKCIHCGQCSKGCYSGAKVVCGQERSVSEIMREVMRDKDYYGAEGGLTISGGEPLLQSGFTKSLADSAGMHGISTAIETSLFLFDKDVLSSFDLIMFDLKAFDPELHYKYTGVSVEPILDNIRRTSELGIPMIARTPVIPGVNDSEIPYISEFLHRFASICKYELLPYHPLGLSKAAALGIEQERFNIPTKSMMEELQKYAFRRNP